MYSCEIDSAQIFSQRAGKQRGLEKKVFFPQANKERGINCLVTGVDSTFPRWLNTLYTQKRSQTLSLIAPRSVITFAYFVFLAQKASFFYYGSCGSERARYIQGDGVEFTQDQSPERYGLTRWGPKPHLQLSTEIWACRMQ